MNKILAIIIGAVVVTICGGGQIMVLTIVCTAGLGLLVVIPVCWAIGAIILQIFLMFSNNAGFSNLKTVKGNHNDALSDYIKQARQIGMTDNSIIMELKAHGWQDEDIKPYL